MRAVIQRVRKASVSVEGNVVGTVGTGLLVFLGVSGEDTEADIEWLVSKIASLRIFEDADGLMNDSLESVSGGVLVISQFTLFGNLRKGSRPSFNRAAPPEFGKRMYEHFIEVLSKRLGEGRVACGQFGAMMHIHVDNWGPVTLIVDTSDKRF